MTARPGELLPRPARATRGQLMHVDDAGYGGAGERGVNVTMQCAKCSYQSPWLRCETVTEAKRGLPCPRCNATTDEQSCPGHVAHSLDPKICAHCGVHIDELRPD